jgi:hypothetical protein
MAEQSIGMETGTGTPYGDGNVGTGYASSRMIAMETKTLSDGVLQTGSLLTMTGNGTNTLSIAAGAAIVGGYFYENTSSASIVITSLANGTYNVAILVNSTTGTLTVSRSVSGTTVLAKTVRLVVATDAMVTAWISAGYSYLIMGTVVVNSAVITASGITPNYAMYGTTTQLPYQSYTQLTGGTVTMTLANTQYDIVSYSSATTTSDAIFSAVNATGIVTVRRAGLYSINAFITYGASSAGTRTPALKVNGTVTQRNMMTPGAATSYSASTWTQILAAGDTVNISSNNIGAAGSTVTDCLFTVARA